jgi:UDP-glucose 4-epimerase
VAFRAARLSATTRLAILPWSREQVSRSRRLHRHLGMSKIVITGATGVIGRRAVRQLLAAGHEVAGVVRSARGRAVVEGLGARALDADVFEHAALTAAFAGADVVVNLLTHIPAADAMAAPEAWAENDRLRREGSAVVADAAQAAGAERLIQESVAFLYTDGGDDWIDEDASVHAAGPTETALAAESNAKRLFAGETVVLRCGLFIGADSALTLASIETARAGISPAVGRPSAYQATVWLDDAAAAVAAAAGAPAGVYNVADADPPRRSEIDAALASAVGRETLRHTLDEVPRELEPIARSQRVSSSLLREATGWEPTVRGGTEGWSLITRQWTRTAA